MSSQHVYTISNASMDIFPENSRGSFSNILPKPIKPKNENTKALYLSLDNLIMENTLVQYSSEPFTPDIYWFNPSNSDSRTFYLDISKFHSRKSLLLLLRKEIRNATRYFKVKDNNFRRGYVILRIHFKSGLFIINTSKVLNIYISKRFLTFLGFVYTENTHGPIESVNLVDISNKEIKSVMMCRLPVTGLKNSGLVANKIFCHDLMTPNTIQVICKNIEPNLSGDGHNCVIEMIPINLQRKVLDYRPKIKKIYKVRTNELKSIQVELRDEKNKLVKFKPGVPNIVKLEISEMSVEKNNFYIRFSSNDSKSIFPANTCSNFRTRLPKEMHLGLNWKTSLTSIFLPKNIHNIYDSMNKITIIQYYDSTLTKIEGNYIVYVQPGYYDSVHSFCSAINLSLSLSPVKIHIHEKSKRFYLAGYNKHKNPKCIFKIAFSRKLLGMMGYEPGLLIDTSDSDRTFNFKYLDNAKNSQVLICDTFNTLNTNAEMLETYLFPAQQNLNFSISPWIFVYCDIIQPSVTGHSTVPLLKIIPLNYQDFQRGHALEFETLEFSFLSFNSFQSVHFEIRNHDGTLLSTDNENLMLTLVFQKGDDK